MNRRDFLYSCLMAGISAKAQGQISFNKSERLPLIIFLELKGGNDFLSTLVPYSDPLYTKFRPQLAIQKSEVNAINSALGFHRNIPLFNELFKNNELAIIQGVGCKKPSFSHFRGIEVWDSGSSGEEIIYDGWAARAIKTSTDVKRTIDGIGIGVSGAGPAKGLGKKLFLIENPQRLLDNLNLQNITEKRSSNESLNHIISIQENINEAQLAMKNLPDMSDISYSGLPFIVSVRVVKKILSEVKHLPYLKFTHAGYDSHASQHLTHPLQMTELNDGLTDLVSFLKKSNLWKDTILVTYSEFGRAPQENFAKGTDHGNSSCQFVMGGRVRGGLYGDYPSFTNIQDFQFVPTMDYRSIFSTVIKDFWKLDPASAFKDKIETLNFIKA